MNYYCQFLLDKEKGLSDARLRFRVKWDDNVVAFNLGFRIEVSKWSLATQRCINNTTHGKKKIPASIINRQIDNYERFAEQIFSNSKSLTAEEFKYKFNSLRGKITETETDLNFFQLFDKFIKSEGKKNHWTASTNAKLNTIKNHLYGFNNRLKLEDIDENFFVNYQYYLIYTLKHSNSTIIKNIKFVKWFLRWCEKNGFKFEYNFHHFKPKLKTTGNKIIFLSPKELEQLNNCKIPPSKEFLIKIKDIFLFQCFTGLRYSDVRNLKKNNVYNDYIQITTVKTMDNIIIELNNFSKEILQKYAASKGDYALPVISNQKMNDYIKELGELAQLDEPITITTYIGSERFDTVYPKYALLTSHVGRRTFITNALSLGIAPQIVMKWTGHSDYKSMKPYIDIVDEIKATAMNKFNNLI